MSETTKVTPFYTNFRKYLQLFKEQLVRNKRILDTAELEVKKLDNVYLELRNRILQD